VLGASQSQRGLYVLCTGCTGCQWKALPAERFGSTSAIRKRFPAWKAAGLFEAVWRAGLVEYDELDGIAWRWQSVGGVRVKAAVL
jgi:transposase